MLGYLILIAAKVPFISKPTAPLENLTHLGGAQVAALRRPADLGGDAAGDGAGDRRGAGSVGCGGPARDVSGGSSRTGAASGLRPNRDLLVDSSVCVSAWGVCM